MLMGQRLDVQVSEQEHVECAAIVLPLEDAIRNSRVKTASEAHPMSAENMSVSAASLHDF